MRRFIALLLVPLGAFAQGAPVTEFPADATAPTADELRTRLAGKVFRVKSADGNTWRLEYKSNGYAFIDISSGFRDTGKWWVEGSRACVDWQKAAGGCSEARTLGEATYVKRISNGEVIVLKE